MGRRSLRFESLEERKLLTIDSSEALLASSTASLPTAHVTAEVYAPGATQTLGNNAPVGLTPAQIRHAYGFDQITFDNGAIVGDGAGQTIAIVDAYDDPNIVSDLAAFDSFFGIAAPPSFVRENQTGGTTLPSVDPVGPGNVNWEMETALDVEWAHVLAPGAGILLVEANSDGLRDLISRSVDTARNTPNVVAVSMSWGSNENIDDQITNPIFTTPANHAGVTFVAGSGDSGSPGLYPAFSPNVLAVGGTSISLDGNNNITSESGWSGSGGGISSYESQPSYQNGIVTQSTTMRTIPDVAFDASPSSGVAIYDSYNGGTSPWFDVGGTSFSAPAWTSLITIADQGRSLAGDPVLGGSTSATLPAIYSLRSSDFNNITSGGNGSFPAEAGYDLVTGRGSPKVSRAALQGNMIVSGLTGNVVAPTSQVVNRAIFYAGSSVYDTTGNPQTPLPFSDDNAIATDKSAYLPGSGAATFANVSSYDRGINGVMVDLSGGGSHSSITQANVLDDFTFKVGNNNASRTWAAAPNPTTVTVRAGAGVSGSDRVELIWADGAIKEEWLEVITKATTNTGLTANDVFFFGNAVANSGGGDTATLSETTSVDELGARNSSQTVLNNIPITNLFDYNRDGLVNSVDSLLSRNDVQTLGATRYLNIPIGGPFAPLPLGGESALTSGAAPTGNGGVASALVSTSTSSTAPTIPTWIVNRLDHVDLNHGPVAKYLEHLAHDGTARAKTILVQADQTGDAWNLDDELLDTLLVGLGQE